MVRWRAALYAAAGSMLAGDKTGGRALPSQHEPAAAGELRVRSLAAALLVGLGLGHLYYHASYTLDDAYITFRYARNTARGMGLVYNPGDYVKGYSNTLYTLLMTLPEWLYQRDPVMFSKRLGALSFVWLSVVAYGNYAQAEVATLRDRGLWLLAFVAASAALAIHFVGGLETGLYTALVLAAIMQRLHEQAESSAAWSAPLFAAVVWSRPEGILIFAAAAAHDCAWRAFSRRFHARDLVFYVVPALAYGAELALSQAYYGEPFPQTYYAKTVATHGVLDALRALWTGAQAQFQADAYLVQGLDGLGFGLLGLAALPLALLAPERRRRNSALVLVVLAQLIFIARAGGDWAPGFRFGVPIIPLLWILLVEALGQVAHWAGRRERLAFSLLAAGMLAIALPRQWREARTIQRERPVNAENKLLQGRDFSAMAPAGITLSSFDIGGQGYAAGGFDVLDTVGLTVRETTGCRDRMLPRCVRLAELVRPDLVRLHSNRKRDAFVSGTLRKTGDYLELDGGKLLLDRELVVLAALPAWARPRSPSTLSGTQLIADDLPPSVIIQTPTQVTLYWRRDATSPEALKSRRFEWRGPAGPFSAQGSASIWQRVATFDAWPADRVFADLANLITPPHPGRYALHLIAGGQRIVLGSVDVLGAADLARHATQLSSQAQALLDRDRVFEALHLWGRAAQLSPAAHRPYHTAVVDYAAHLRNQAEALAPRDRVAALRIAQQAKQWLHRAYWESGQATSELSREIDVNAAFRKRLITAELIGL